MRHERRIVSWECERCGTEHEGANLPEDWRLLGLQMHKTWPVKDVHFCGSCIGDFIEFLGPALPELTATGTTSSGEKK